MKYPFPGPQRLYDRYCCVLITILYNKNGPNLLTVNGGIGPSDVAVPWMLCAMM